MPYQLKSEIYTKACTLMNKENFEQAIELFTSLDGFLDSKGKIDECKKRKENPELYRVQVKEIISEPSNKDSDNSFFNATENKIQQEKKTPNKRTLLAVLCSLVAISIIAVIVIVVVNSSSKQSVSNPSSESTTNSTPITETETISNSSIISHSSQDEHKQNESQDSIVRVFDDENLISDQEEQELNKLIVNYIKATNIDLVIVTTSSTDGKSAQDFADDFYDYNGFGIGESKDGILLLVAMDIREWHITTTGLGINIYNDYELDELGNIITPSLSSGEYYQAFYDFIHQCEKVAKNYR